MPTLTLHGVQVEFPYEPYSVQADYMASVVAALSQRSNALLESPTGTGKTLSLLCATLGWVTAQEQAGVTPRPVVFYASRTHAQLAQVIREFKATAYATRCRMAVLGSRDHLCVHSDVTRLPSAHAQNARCNALRRARGCRYAHGVQRFQQAEERDAAGGFIAAPGLRDIEELVAEGRKSVFCPYFYEREAAETAHIVFLPYSYLLEPALTKQLPVKVEGSILLIDEAHNVPGQLRASLSVELTPLDVATAITDAGRAVQAAEVAAAEEAAGSGLDPAAVLPESAANVAALKVMLCNLERCIAAEGAKAGAAGEVVGPGGRMQRFVAQAQFIAPRMDVVQGAIDAAVTALGQTEQPPRGLIKVGEFLTRVFDPDVPPEVVEEAFRFVVFEPSAGPARRPPPKRDGGHTCVLGYWCLDTALAMRVAVRGAASVLLTSGTLSPMDHFAAELGIPFPFVMQGQHVIGPAQLAAMVLQTGPGGVALNSRYAQRDTTEYRDAMGSTVVNLARNTPDGMLVFFPSYAALTGSVQQWSTHVAEGGATVYGMLSELKEVFVEPREAKELPPLVANFQKAVDGGRPAVLLAVCRGKVSEGVDFADRHGRCVVVTGIPFANAGDLHVRLKREYLTAVAPQRPRVGGRLFTGDDWYVNEALRAVNQAIGRVIRHKDDYGVVVLADERFATMRQAISPWVAKGLQVHRAFRESYSAVTQFFAQRAKCAPPAAQTRKTVSAKDSPPRAAVPDAAVAQIAAFAQRQPPVQSHHAAAPARPGLHLVAPLAMQPSLESAAPATPRPPAATLLPVEDKPPSAAELCAAVKNVVAEARYAQFRAALMEMLRLAKQPPGPETERRLGVTVDALAVALAGHTQTAQWLGDLSHFIPVGFRAQYARLIQRHK